MPKKRLLIVSNEPAGVPMWASWPIKINRLKQWLAPAADFSIDLVMTTYPYIPFQNAGLPGYSQVNESWYEANITNRAIGYDVVLFVIPKSQWPADNGAWGYRTLKIGPTVELQIACDENTVMYVPNFVNGQYLGGANLASDGFFEEARHEILHALFMLTGQPDTTHQWAANYNQLEKALSEVKFKPVPMNYPLSIAIPFNINFINIPAAQFMKGRDGWKPDMIVIHATEGNRASVIQTFQDTSVPKSTHFMVCKTGEVVQFVSTSDTAFGNGIQVNPVDPIVLSRNKQGVNPNFYTISIEHELLVNETPTEAQYVASGKLMKFLSQKWGITLDSAHVIPHHNIDAAKTCPNKVDIGHLLTLAKA